MPDSPYGGQEMFIDGRFAAGGTAQGTAGTWDRGGVGALMPWSVHVARDFPGRPVAGAVYRASPRRPIDRLIVAVSGPARITRIVVRLTTLICADRSVPTASASFDQRFEAEQGRVRRDGTFDRVLGTGTTRAHVLARFLSATEVEGDLRVLGLDSGDCSSWETVHWQARILPSEGSRPR